MLDVQALWACQFITSHDKPSKQEMLADMEIYSKENDRIVERGGFQESYFENMVEATGYQLDVGKAC